MDLRGISILESNREGSLAGKQKMHSDKLVNLKSRNILLSASEAGSKLLNGLPTHINMFLTNLGIFLKVYTL